MAKSKNKVWFDFSGFTEMAEKCNDLYNRADEIAKECLTATHKNVTAKITKDIERHIVTGNTKKSIYDKPVVTKEGQNAYSVNIGFDIENGGLPSIFLMYGTPRQKPDTKFRADLFGKKTKTENFEIQNKIFQKYVNKLNEG